MPDEIRNRVMISACLLGQRVRYDGGHSAQDHPVLARWREQDRLVPFCPEVAGGLSTPRAAAELVGGDGAEVLEGKARVVDRQGTDVTDAFIGGAQLALDAAREANVTLAVLKSKSPSCGHEQVYDGTFSGTLATGKGVTAALLVRHGIAVFNEHQLDQADAYLRQLREPRTGST